MPNIVSITIDDKKLDVEPKQTILEVCKNNDIPIPTLCHLKGVTDVGACRLCLVEIEGSPRLFPACTTPIANNQKIRTNSEKLAKYRRLTVELLFSERNHFCAVCIANNHCDLQSMGYEMNMDHVRFPFLYQECTVDTSHPFFVMDHNRCIMCTRCVRVCDEVEGAHNWDVTGRGYASRVISDFNQPWAESTTCTSCGKCVDVCPTGSLWHKGSILGQLLKKPEKVTELVEKRGIKS